MPWKITNNQAKPSVLPAKLSDAEPFHAYRCDPFPSNIYWHDGENHVLLVTGIGVIAVSKRTPGGLYPIEDFGPAPRLVFEE